MRKYKVIQLVEDLSVGGLETTVYQIVTHLDPKKYNVWVCCLEEGGTIADELSSSAYKVDILGLSNYYHPGQVLSLMRYFLLHKPDIVHTHGEFASTFVRSAALLTRVPIILRHIQTKANLKFRHEVYDGLLTRLSDGAIAVSRDCAEHHVKRCHIPPEKVIVIPNGVDLDKLNSAPYPKQTLEKWNIDNDSIVIGCVGRLSPIKGHIYMIRAMPQVLKKHANAYLLIIGDGPERQNLLNEARRLSVSNRVILSGLRRDVASLLKALRVFVLPSTEVEGLPLSVAEAMCAGAPVVASDVGGVSEIVKDEESGLLVLPKNSSQLSTAVLRILDDAMLSEKLTRNALRMCQEEYAVDIIVKRIQEVYERFLSMKRNKLSTHLAISL